MASRRLLLYATDTYKLSSLVVRRVLLAKPATLAAYREKTRQLLLDQSVGPASVNRAAVKLLEWDRELNLIRYYGVGEYAKRWWASRSRPTRSAFSSDQPAESISTNGERVDEEKGSVARVAFMITARQRRELSSSLGYDPQDIRSFKPIEALLLLEHGVKKDAGDFRAELKRLVEENERSSTKAVPRAQLVDPAGACNEDGPEAIAPVQKSTVAPKEAERIRAKPDVVLALLSVDANSNDMQRHEAVREGEVTVEALVPSAESTGVDEAATSAAELMDEMDRASASSDIGSPPPPEVRPGTKHSVTPRESEELHMKPDVAAAMLASEQRNGPRGEEELDDQEAADDDDGRPCWYEVVERTTTKRPTTTIGTAHESRNRSPGSDATNDEQVIALFPTKEEALECVRIKRSLRGRARDANGGGGEGRSADRFIVRRRWNV